MRIQSQKLPGPSTLRAIFREVDVTGQKATSSIRPRYCSVSTEAMASVAFNMSARAAVGGAQLKLSAQRKRGAYPRIVPRGPVSGAPSAGISPRV